MRPWLSTKRRATLLLASQASTAALLANSAKPSPWAMAIGMREPTMPLRKIDGDGWTSTMATRASNCSERLRTKRGQWSLPGMSSRRLDSIWQPLHTPREKVSGRAKKSVKADRKSTRLNSSHVRISYAVFCLKKKKQENLLEQNVT